MRLRKRLNKKGVSLRSISLLLIFSVLCVTIFMNAVYDGIQYYDKTLTTEHSKTFEDINGTLGDIDTNARQLQSKVKSIKETPLTAVFFIPAAIIDALQLTFDYVSYGWNIITHLNETLGIPLYIIVTIDLAIIILICYLIIDAFMRYKKT